MREEFIQSFVGELIRLAYKPIPELEVTQEPLQLELTEQFTQPLPAFLNMIPSMMHNFQLPEQYALPLPKQQHFPNVPLPPMKPPRTYSPNPQAPQNLNIGKMTKILYDPSVWSVECPGPGKGILVNRAGSILTSSITLTPEEIQQVLNEFSERTRIPLIQGVFKAVYQDLLITAVISEFVGTRFVLQKRLPFAATRY